MVWTIAENVLDAWIGDDGPADTFLIDTWIGKAERLIRFKIPGIQARLDAGEVDLLENVVDVTAAMVIRKFRNPEGIRQSNTTTGPFTESRTYGGNDPGELVLQDDEVSRLAGATGGHAFSVSMIPSTSPFYVAS